MGTCVGGCVDGGCEVSDSVVLVRWLACSYVINAAVNGASMLHSVSEHISLIALCVSMFHNLQPMWQHADVFVEARGPDVVLSVRCYPRAADAAGRTRHVLLLCLAHMVACGCGHRQVMCFIVRFFMYWVLFMFLLVAVHDYTRTAFAARMLYNLITPQTKDTCVAKRAVAGAVRAGRRQWWLAGLLHCRMRSHFHARLRCWWLRSLAAQWLLQRACVGKAGG